MENDLTFLIIHIFNFGVTFADNGKNIAAALGAAFDEGVTIVARDTERGGAPVWRMAVIAAASLLGTAGAAWSDPLTFTEGDLVLSLYGAGNILPGNQGYLTQGNAGTSQEPDANTPYQDNYASPITLDQVTTGGALAGQMVLRQSQTTINGVVNDPISGEYGSSSEGTLELSGNGEYLTIAGYGVSASTFNAKPASFGGGQKSCITNGAGSSTVMCYPLAQTTSLSTSPTAVPRVVALIGANGGVNTTTALYNVFNENNPRSVATVNGTTLYLSGEGLDGDNMTQGVFVTTLGSSSAKALYTTTDTRTVEIYNNQLYVSADTKVGSGKTAYIATVGSGLPTSGATYPNSGTQTVTPLKGISSGTSSSQFPGEITLGNGNGNSINGSSGKIYLSPENYFFANSTTLYVADSGDPKAGGLGDGGLQKWSLVGTTWELDYTLTAGLLDFVPDTTSCGPNEVNCGTTGLIGQVVGNNVELFATNSTLGDEDQTYLYGITDVLADTAAVQETALETSSDGADEKFAVLDSAGPDTNIRGVAFAPSGSSSLTPVPEPGSLSLLGSSIIGLFAMRRRRRKA